MAPLAARPTHTARPLGGTPRLRQRRPCRPCVTPARCHSSSSSDSTSSSASSSSSSLPAPPQQLHVARRSLLLAAAGAATGWRALAPATALATPQPPLNKEVDAAESPYIQELLRRSAEKKEERTKERLDAFNKKIFREYFQFEAGDERAAAARGISKETSAAIARWLQENQ